MRSLRRLLVLSAVSILATAFLAAPAGASPVSHVSVSGTIAVVDNTVLSSHDFGPVNLTRAVANVTFGGDLVGPAVENYSALTLPGGSVLQHGTGSFTGSIAGRSGSIAYVFHGDAAHGGVITITRSTGGLCGVSGQIHYTNGSAPGLFDYTGRLTLR